MHPTLQRLAGGCTHGTYPPAEPEAIAQFEKKHGIAFPAYYREFLLFSNGEYFVDTLYGLDSLEEENATGEYKPRTVYKVPDSFYIVGHDGGGDPLCIDLATQEFVVWFYDGEEEGPRWDSLFDYIDYALDIAQEVEEQWERKQQEEREREQWLQERRGQWRKESLCQHCGGSFTLMKKCRACGLKKDY